MLHILQFLASLFAGAAIYINLVEHPARMGCDTNTAVTVWAPSYKKATVMQASLAIVGLLSGLAAWLLGGGVLWLFGALFIGSVVPFTFIVIMPTNHKLLEPGRDLSSEETRTLLEHWGKLHGVRSALSLIASVLYIVLLLSA
jgi:uncharacterized membrane protein